MIESNGKRLLAWPGRGTASKAAKVATWLIGAIALAGLLLMLLGSVPPKMLVDRAIAAHGGLKTMLGRQTRVCSGTNTYALQSWAPEGFTEYIDRGRYLFVSGSGAETSEYFLGTRDAWFARYGISFNEAPGGRGGLALGEEEDFALLTLARARQANQLLKSLGWKRLPDGAWTQAVLIKIPLGADLIYFFDPISGRVSAVTGARTSKPEQGAMDSVLRFLDYRWIDDLLIPGRRIAYDDGKCNYTTRVRNISFHITDPSRVFARPQPSTAAGVTSVPLYAQEGMELVCGTMNGTLRGRFVVDTGAFATTIYPPDASRLRMAHGTGVNAYMSSGLFRYRTGTLRTFQIGRAVVHNLPVRIGAQGQDATFARRGYSGRLGISFLAHFQVTVDYPRRRLILSPRSSPLPRGDVIPAWSEGDVLVILAKIDGLRSPMGVDTGTEDVFLRSSAAPTIRFGRALPYFTWAVSSGRHWVVDAGRLGSLQVGRQLIRAIPVAFVRPQEVTPDSPLRSIGLLGYEFLRRFRVTFDYARERVVLVPERSSAPDPWIYPGFEIDRSDPAGAATVGRVDSGSPAARAGLRRGDPVLSVDGRPTKRTELWQLRLRLRGPEGSFVTVQVGRPGHIRTVRLRRVRML